MGRLRFPVSTFSHSQRPTFSAHFNIRYRILLAVCVALISGISQIFAQTVSAPVFNPVDVMDVAEIKVAVTCATSPVTIRYTTSGEDPTLNDDIVTSGTVTIRTNCTLKAKAWNATGQSSAVTSAEYRVSGMVSSGFAHAVALRFDGRVFAWGEQTSGGLGNGSVTSGTISTPVDLKKTGTGGGSVFSGAVEVAAGDKHTLIIEKTGTAAAIWATGANGSGQLGSGTNVNQGLAVQVLTGTSTAQALQVAAGKEFSLALAVASGTTMVYSWGEGSVGRLGSGANTDRWFPGLVLVQGGTMPLTNIAMISAGRNFAGAVDSGTSGNLWMWGANSAGQLGIGTTVDKDKAVKAKLRTQVFPEVTEDLSGITAVSCGEDHTVVIRTTGTLSGAVYAWGERQYGTLGNGETSAASVQFPQRVEKVGGGFLDGIDRIDAGAHVTLALDETGEVWAWGRNNTGALGSGDTANRAYAGRVLVTGTSDVSQNRLKDIVWISAGGEGSGFCLALDKYGQLWAWGDNTNAILGTGTASATPVSNALVASGTHRFSNRAPTGTLDISGAPFTAPATVTLTGNVSDPDGNIARVDFYQNTTLLSSDTTSTYTTTVTSLGSGTYSFSAKVYDKANASALLGPIPLGIPLPTVSVTGTPATILESSGSSATFRISRALGENTSQSLTVNFTLTGSALNGGDYTVVNPQTATIASGSQSVNVAISPVNDAFYEGSENVLMTLTTSATSYNIQTGTATITITEPGPDWIGKISGDGQISAPDAFLAQPLVVEVRSGTTKLINAPVVFAVASGSGGLAVSSTSSATVSGTTVATGSNGQAQIWYKQGPTLAVTSTITAQSGTLGAVSFTSETASGLWSRWKFNEGTGTTAAEATGLGVSGTLANGPGWVQPGYDGNYALTFTASNSYVTMGTPTAHSLDLGPYSFTLEAWVKFTEAAGVGETRRILGKGLDGWGAGYLLGLRGDGKLAAGVGSTTGAQADALLIKTTGTYNTGEWRHVAVVVDREAGTAKIYVDGTASALEKEAGTGGTVSGTAINIASLTNLSASGTGVPFTVASQSGTAAFFKGLVDDVQVHREALSATQVQAGYNASEEVGGAADTLPDWWEWRYFGNLDQLDGGNSDGDPYTNLQEYQNGSNPTDYFNGVTPVLEKISGDGQSGPSGDVLPNPLVVKVMTSGSTALDNAPVLFSVSGSLGQVATSGTGTFAATQAVRADASGLASVYWKPSGTGVSLNQVQAQVTTGTTNVTVTFSATTRLPAAVSMISGDRQAGPPSTYLAEPLVVEVRSGTGAVLPGEPVLFTVTSGSGGLATSFGGTSTGSTLSVTTGSDGRAKAYYLLGSGTGAANTITAVSGTSAAVTFNEKTTQADGLWAQWKFDEGTGTTAADATSLTVSGTLVNGAAWTTGTNSPQAMLFTGSNPYVTMGTPANAQLDFGKGNFTLALWVKYTGEPASPDTWRILSKGHTGWGAGYILALRGDGKLTAGLGSTTSQQADSLLFETTEEYNDGEWHHVAAVFDQVGGEARIYVDGEAQALTKEAGTGGTIDGGTPTIITFSGMQNLSATQAGVPFTISSFSGTSEFFAGEVHDARIYRRALAGADVEDVYNFSGDGDSLPDWWEWKYLGTLSQGDAGNDDGDLYTNLQEYEQGKDPKDYYNGVAPVLEKLSGDGQSAPSGQMVANPLVVKVTSSGTEMPNAPVKFLVSGSNGQIAASGTDTFGTVLDTVTGTAGTSAVYLKTSGTMGSLNQIVAQATTGTSTVSVSFSATTSVVSTGSMSIVSGNDQTGRAFEYLTDPLTIEVRSGTNNAPQSGVPVTYTVTSGTGGLSTQFGGTSTSGTLELTTGSNGRAQAYFRQAADESSTISVTSGTSVATFSSTLAGGGAWSAWSFDEGYGNTARETTGLGVDGTLTNTPFWSAGFDGNGGVEFSGSNSYVTMSGTGTSARSLDLGTDSFTVAFWVRYTEVPGSSETFRIVSKGFENFGPGYFVGLRGDGKLAAGLGATSGTSSTAVLFKTTGSFNDGEWHHVGVVVDRTNAISQIYVDGTARSLEKEVGTGGTVASGTLSLAGLSSLSASGTSVPFTVSSFSGSSQFFKGEVDEVKIYKSALAAQTVGSLYNVDTDGNELPDWWEYEHFTFVGADPEEDADRDGLTNSQEYEQGSDPRDYYNQGANTITPVISLISGDGQTSGPDQFLADPFTVEVLSGTGAPLVNAPVTFTVTSGSGAVASTANGASTTPKTVYTGSNGRASAWYRQGSEVNVTSTITAQAGASNVLAFEAATLGTNSLVGHWKFDEGTGASTADSSPFVHTGTLVYSPAWQERFDGESSLAFSGSAHVATLSGTDGMLDFADASFSVTSWIKSGTTPVAGRIVSKGNDNANAGYYLALNAQGQIETALGTTQSGTSSETIRIKTTGSFNDNTWHAVAAVYDRRTSTAKIYVDGTIRTIAKEAGSGGTINVSGSTQLDYGDLQNLSGSRNEVPLTIASQSGTSRFFQGGIDEVRVYRKALSAAEVLDLYEEEGELVAVSGQMTIEEDTLGTIALQARGGGEAEPAYQIVTEPTNGEVTLSGSQVKYYANAHFSGTDGFRFRVTKGTNSAEADVHVTVTPVNDAPLVSVGGSQSVTMSGSTATVVLSATVTDIDTDLEDISLKWTKVSGSGQVTFTGTNLPSFTATFDSPGEYVLRLSAYDGTSTQADSLSVVINPNGTSDLPTIALVAPEDDTAFEFSQGISISASAVAGTGKSISKVEYYEGSRKIGQTLIPNPSTGLYDFVWLPPRIGAFRISAKTTDSSGAKTISQSLQVRVTDQGWFSDPGTIAGNDGYAGSGGDGGVTVGAPTGPGSSHGPGSGGNGGGNSSGGGGDGMGNPSGSSPESLDTDEDGLSDSEEAEIGTIPTQPDTDGDGVPDGEDGWALISEFAPPRLDQPSYALVDLEAGDNSWARFVNDKADAVVVSGTGPNQFWRKGEGFKLIEDEDGNRLIPIGISSSGDVAANGVPNPLEAFHSIVWEGDGETYVVVRYNPEAKGAAIWHPDASVTYLNHTGKFSDGFSDIVNTGIAEPYVTERLSRTSAVVAVNNGGDTIGAVAENWELEFEYWDVIYLQTAVWSSGGDSADLRGDRYRRYIDWTHGSLPESEPNIKYGLDAATILYDAFLMGYSSFPGAFITSNKIIIGKFEKYNRLRYGGSDEFEEEEFDSVEEYWGYLSPSGTEPQKILLDEVYSVSPNNHMLGLVGEAEALVIDQTTGLRGANPTTENPSYGTPIVWPTEGAGDPPIQGKLNSAFRIMGGNKIWQNGKLLNLNDLVPECSGTAPTESFYAYDQSEAGIIAGYAKKIRNENGDEIPQIEQKTRAAVLLPFELRFWEVTGEKTLKLVKSPQMTMGAPEVIADAISVTNVRASADGTGLLADITIQAHVSSPALDTVEGKKGVIDSLQWEMDPGAVLGENAGEVTYSPLGSGELRLSVQKDSNADSDLHPYPYEGSISTTLTNVKILEGANVLRLSAYDGTHKQDGRVDVGFVIEATPNSATTSWAETLSIVIGTAPSASVADSIHATFLNSRQTQLTASLTETGTNTNVYRSSDNSVSVTLGLVQSGSCTATVQWNNAQISAHQWILIQTAPQSTTYSQTIVLDDEEALGNYNNYTVRLITEEFQGSLQGIFSLPFYTIGESGNVTGENVGSGVRVLGHGDIGSIHNYMIEVVFPSSASVARDYRAELKKIQDANGQIYKIEQIDVGYALSSPGESPTPGRTFLRDGQRWASFKVVAGPVKQVFPEHDKLTEQTKDVEGKPFSDAFSKGFCDHGAAVVYSRLAQYTELVKGTVNFAGEFVQDPQAKLETVGGQVYTVSVSAWDTVNRYAPSVAAVVERINSDADAAVIAYLAGDEEALADLSEPYRYFAFMAAELVEEAYDEFKTLPDHQEAYLLGMLSAEIVALLAEDAASAGVGAVASKVMFLRKLENREFFKDGRAANVAKKMKAFADTLDSFAKMCFVAGTPVHTIDGLLPIQEIKEGMLVWSCEPSTGRKSLKRVAATFITHPDKLYHIRYSALAGRNGEQEELVCTGEHPFFEIAQNRFVPASQIVSGARLRTIDGSEVQVVGISEEYPNGNESFETYNFEVESFHTYFVGKTGVWVHNRGKAPCEEIASAFLQSAKKLGLRGDALRANRFRLLEEARAALVADKSIPTEAFAEAALDVSKKMHQDFLNGVISDVDELPSVREWRNFLNREPNPGSGGKQVHHAVEEWIQERIGIPKTDLVPGYVMNGLSGEPPLHKTSAGLASRLQSAIRPLRDRQETINKMREVYVDEFNLPDLWKVAAEWLRKQQGASDLVIPD